MSSNSAPSDRKLKANRENGKKSTGPKTEAGKSRSKFNAYRHGILSQGLIFSDDTESRAYKKFFKRLHQGAKPKNVQESLLVEEIAILSWKLCIAESFVHDAFLSRQKASAIAIQAFESRSKSFSADPTGEFDAEKLGRYAGGLTCESIVLSSNRLNVDSSDPDKRERQREELSVRLTPSVETTVGYEARLRRDLYHAIELLRRLQSDSGD